MNKVLFFIFLFVSALKAAGQIPMQSWRVHFSVFNAVGVASDQNAVYHAASNGIVKYNTDDNSIEMLTVANGLSDLGISTISGNDTLVFVGYSNGNIDLINGNTITNIPWIRLAEISGNKQIYDANFQNDLIYISTGFGIVVYDILKNEVRDTYYPNSNVTVHSTAIHNDTIFAATGSGIYFAALSQPFLNDVTNWTKKTDLPSAIINAEFSEISSFGSKLVFVYNSSTYDADTIYYLENGSLNKYGTATTVTNLTAGDEQLDLPPFGGVDIVDLNMNQVDFIYQYNAGIPEPIGCIKKDNFLWIADRNHGLVKLTNNWSNDVIYKNSLYADGCYRLDIQYGKVLVAGGGLTHNQVNNYFRNGVYQLEDETWTNYNHETSDSIDYDKDWDFISVAINPNNTDQMAFGSASQGGLKYISNGSAISEVYNQSNSTLEINGSNYTISDIRFDETGNMWVVCSGVEPLKVMTPQGDWYSFSLGSAAKDKFPYRLFIDSNGNKWVGISNAGLFAFNENGTLADQSDDQLRSFSTSEGSGNLPSVYVKSITEDLDGEIWIGTEEGMVVLYSTDKIYDGNYGEYDFNPILIEVNGEVEKLLGTTYITSLTVDGGNRKWIGTNSSGVFCLSPDGTEEIYRFDTENSPLVSNNVLDIRVDHLSGEVYFATDKGLVSFRADASIFDEDFENVTVFPNPVRPDFSGPITIQGLGYQSDLKVTDISGNLIYKTTSNGGTVIWDGLTLTGERVQSGVYLVWTASVDGKGKEVAKILFMN
ncbi:MAG: hypothetical protein IPM77_13305 [Crocinitomicaceae bacterium]|nr:hypothetical protein [Crocinitomicaceae bacterium]